MKVIEITRGDLLRADVEAIINTVNCVGVMGRGIALQFKKAWPDNFKAYADACKKKQVQPGKMFIFTTQELANPRFIINFPTKRHWRGASLIEDIDSGLSALVKDIRKLGIKSIAIPPLGAGLGGLDWTIVRQKIETAMEPLDDVHVLIYEPSEDVGNVRVAQQQEIPKMTTGRAVLIELIQRYLKGSLDPSISLLEVHKLLYFMQEAGEPLRLKYQKAHYGPYAENLRHVLNIIEGHFISGYVDGGDIPNKELHLISGSVEMAQKFLQQYPETRERFEKVSALVEGFESPQGLELLATVHWLHKYEQAKTTQELLAALDEWNERKQIMTERQVQIAKEVLSTKNWLVE
ncbi:MAG: type II toxin-antitoxin system antitoxin DNA ADP-ribosyl glycohydrolase DarG [Providencia rustigianii]|uniref:type II toxin-antitoxin system antitoxin DNA ADP-ribosyl glycohydrolase DarG n=1 Tax=Providencia rustigianii TaxID=158850 RepID=UPI003F3ED117